MDALLTQARSKFRRKEEFNSTREGRTTPQRTSTFQGEKKPQKWFWRQSSRQMSFNKSGDEAEYAAAVAATALAISSLESDEVNPWDIKGPQQSLPRIRSTIMDTPAAMTDPGEASKSYADEKNAYLDTPNAERNEMVPEKTIHPVPSIKRPPTVRKKKLSFADQQTEGPTPSFAERTPSFKRNSTFDEYQFENKERIRPPGRKPTVKKTPTFGEDRVEDVKRMKPEISPSPIPPPPFLPLTTQPSSKGAQKPQDQETDADAWEREEMAKIKGRYDKLNATILDWEEKKRKKAKRKLETTESELNKRRTKAMQKYQIEMEQIKQIVEGAKAQASEKQRNEELKVKEKAHKYRTTGEPPLPPLCRCL